MTAALITCITLGAIFGAGLFFGKVCSLGGAAAEPEPCRQPYRYHAERGGIVDIES